MNKDQTLALWKQGKNAWNDWAKTFSDKTSPSRTHSGSQTSLNEEMRADFSEVVFHERADFSEFIFPGDVLFTKAVFLKGACFDRARFEGDACFQRADFRGVVTFATATFTLVPDFRFCGFLHVPPFGKTRFPGAGVFNRGWRKQIDATARYQALKALARRGGHYQHITDFTAREIVTRRNIVDQWWQPRFWLGLLYQLTSDFGRSVARPFLLWAATIPLYAFFYLSYYQERATALMPDDMTNLSGWWLTMRNWFSFGKHISVSGLECDVDRGRLLMKSLYLSLKTALLNIGGAADLKLKQVYTCLYGENKKLGGTELMPVIPDPVSFLVLSQMSLAIIFLLLLIVGLIYQYHKK